MPMLILDLGAFRPSIMAEGKIDEVASIDGGITVPSKVNFEDAVRTWYDTTITFTVSGDSYVSKIASCRFTMESTKETFWVYQLRLVTQGRT